MHFALPGRLAIKRAPAGQFPARSQTKPAARKEVSNVAVVESVPKRYRATVVRSRREVATVEFDSPTAADSWTLGQELAAQIADADYTLLAADPNYGAYVENVEVIGDAGPATTEPAAEPAPAADSEPVITAGTEPDSVKSFVESLERLDAVKGLLSPAQLDQLAVSLLPALERLKA
jgi:hypothetical protein